MRRSCCDSFKSRGLPGICRQLQRWCTSDQPIELVDAGDSRYQASRARQGNVDCACTRELITQLVCGYLRHVNSLNLLENILRRLKVKTEQAQLVGQHAQYFPGRTRIAQRFDNRMKALYSAFSVHESTRGLRKWSNRQQHIAKAHVRLEGAQCDD